MAFCSGCGKELSEDARFCNGCGTETTQSEKNITTQTQTYQAPDIKTPLYQGETIVVRQTATSFNRMPRISGKMILTNQRLIWEKGGLANIAGIGLLSLAGDKYMCVPLNEIMSIFSVFILGASGIEFSTRAGLKHKFSLNGIKHKESKEKIVDYINEFIKRNVQ